MYNESIVTNNSDSFNTSVLAKELTKLVLGRTFGEAADIYLSLRIHLNFSFINNITVLLVKLFIFSEQHYSKLYSIIIAYQI